MPPAASLDLAMIGNCAISALVDATAHVVWCCMPRFDSTPVFDALLQSANGVPEAGAMAIEIEGMARHEQSYDHGTAILRTRMWDGQGSAWRSSISRRASSRVTGCFGRHSWCDASARYPAVRACA